MIVGGGDSAIESALLLMNQNTVIISYRSEQFSRLKPKNKENLDRAISDGSIKVIFNSDLVSINESSVMIKVGDSITNVEIDLVYIFAGGELPSQFLKNAGIQITKKFGHIIKKHT